MRLVLIDNENVVIGNIVKSITYKEVFAARDAEKDLTAIVDMHIGIGVSMLGIIDSEALILTCVGDG